MALGPREFVEEVEKYFDLIEQRRKNKKSELGNLANRVKLSQIDLDDLKEDIIEIAISLHRLFISQETINNLSPADTIKLIKKARLIALASVILIFKEYDNKQGENFWQFYSKEASLSVNDNFYINILEPALLDEEIVKGYVKRIDSYTDIIAREADVSKSVLEDILYIFCIYKKYFYPNLQIRDFFRDINSKSSHNVLASIPTSTEKDAVNESYARISDFKEKSINTLNDLVRFTNYIDFKPSVLSNDNIEQIVSDYQSQSNHNIEYILKFEDLKESFISLFQSVNVSKLINILHKEDKESMIHLPDGTDISIKELISTNIFSYGVYSFNNKTLKVTPNQAFDEEYFCAIEKNKITIQGNKVIIRSFQPFEIKIGLNSSIDTPLKIYKANKFQGYLWYGNKPIIEVLSFVSEKVIIAPLEPQENIVSSLNLKLITQQNKPQFNLDLAYLLLVLKESKGKKIEIVSTDQTSTFKDFMLDNVGFSGKITYPIKNKKPGIIDLYLTVDREPLPLKTFEPRLKCELEDIMLFDGRLKTKIAPSDKMIDYVSSKLYLFTTIEFESRWVNEVCEVSSFDRFGDYNVYEIEWVDRTKALDINIDGHYSWTFLKVLEIDIQSKEHNYHNKYVDYKDNIFHNIRDVRLSVLARDNTVNIKDLEIKACYNYEVTNSNVKLASINNALERTENNNLIDELFIRTLLNHPAENRFGRYDFELSHNCVVLAKFTLFIVPELSVKEFAEVYVEGEDIILTVDAKSPCFRNGKTVQNYLFDTPAKCNLTINSNKLIEYHKTKYIKVAKLYNPYTEINIKYEPEIIGYRFMQDNRLYSTNMIDYYNLDKTSVVIKASQRDARLKINSNVVKPIAPNSSNIILEPMKASKEYISRNSNDITIQMGNKNEVSFEVIWNTKVSKLSCQNMLYSAEDGISFYISYDGPSHSQLRFTITDENNKNIDIKKIVCADDSSPKLTRYDRHKNCVFITCDGKKWENRLFTFYLDSSLIEGSTYVNLEGIYEDNKESFGKITFKNETSEPELKELNEKIKQDIKNPYLYFERGFLYSEINKFLLAEQDFDKSLSLKLDDEEASGYIEVFKESLSNNLLTYELSQITNLARKLYTDELLLEVE